MSRADVLAQAPHLLEQARDETGAITMTQQIHYTLGGSESA